MAESPEEVRARILAEELAKGSDPRVAEGRSKAAEARARHGYPIDPQEAWKVKLEKETGQAPAAPAAPSSPPATAPATASADASDAGAHPAQPVDSEARLPDESAPASAAAPPAAPPAPAAAPAGASAAAAVPATALAAAPVVVEPAFEPEFGEVMYSDEEPKVITMAGGIQAREGPVPVWIMVALLTIAMWAIVYLIGSGGPDVDRNATGCAVHSDRTLECFLPPEGEGSDAPSGGGH